MKSIDICGINHKINEVEDLFNWDTHLGQINYSKAEILLNKDLPDDLKNQALIHEILHGIFTLTGYENLSQDETLIKTLSCELNRIFEIKGDYKIIEHDGCTDCKHLSKTSKENPCYICKQNYKDKYERVE